MAGGKTADEILAEGIAARGGRKDKSFYIVEMRADKIINAYFKNGFRKARAYLVGYPNASKTTAVQEATKYFNIPAIRAKICEQRERLMEKFKVDEDRIIQELACIAFFDIRDLLTPEGSLLPIDEIPEETRRAMNGLDIEELYRGVGDAREIIGRLKRAKIISKEKALELLGKHLGMFKDRVVHSGKVEASVKVQKSDLAERIQQLVEDDIADALQ